MYIKTVQRLQRNSVPRDANIVPLDVVNKTKVEYNDSHCLRAHVAYHDSKDSDKHSRTLDCFMCASTGMRVLSVTATIRGWYVLQIDIDMAFRQSGPADRKVFVILPKGSKLRDELMAPTRCWIWFR